MFIVQRERNPFLPVFVYFSVIILSHYLFFVNKFLINVLQEVHADLYAGRCVGIVAVQDEFNRCQVSACRAYKDKLLNFTRSLKFMK